VQSTVPEWLPPRITSPIGPFFFAGVLFSAVVLVIAPRRVSFYQLATFVIFTALGLWTTRGVVWYGLVMAPILAENLSAIGDSLPRKRMLRHPTMTSGLVNLGLLGLLLLLSAVSLPWFRSAIPMRNDYRSLLTRDTPVEAIRFLMDEHPRGRVFNDMAFGSYMIWAAQPDYQVFADPRIELFPQAIWDDYQQISRTEPGWEEKLNQYAVHTLVLNPGVQSALAREASRSNNWQLIHQDGTAHIYQRIQ
jgi:hypothetical protein